MKGFRVIKDFSELIKDAYRRQPVKMGLFFFCLFVLIAIEAWDRHVPLPVHDWISRNLQEIRIKDPNDFSFAVFGDNKNGFRTFKRLLKRVNGDPDMAFAMDVGDLVFDGKKERYRHFYNQVQADFRLPLLTTIGNHELREKGRGLYYEMFGPFYYSFKIVRNYFIVLDDANETGLGDWQRMWLEQELRKAQSYKNCFVFMHVPLFDPRGNDYHHCLPEEQSRSLLSLFRKYHVTHIFTAHIHGYFTGQWEGIPYTITGGAGAELLGTDPRHYFYHFLKVRVKNDEPSVKVQRIPSPEFEWVDRLSSAAWLYVYGFLRFNGIELAVFLLMGELLILAFANKPSE